MKIQFQNSFMTVFESSLYRTCSAVIDLKLSIIIVDPNWLPAEIQFIRDFIDKKYAGKPLYLLFTHSDYDHIIGWKAFPEATVIASEAFENNDNKQMIINQIKKFDDSYYIKRNYEILYPVCDIAIKSDTSILKIGSTELHFFHAPGHVSDGLFVIIPELKIWITGDYLSNIEIPMIDHDYDAYVDTIKKALEISQKFEIDYLITGHGDMATVQEEISRRITNDTEYLQNLKEAKICSSAEFKSRLLIDYSSNNEVLKIHESNLTKIRFN